MHDKSKVFPGRRWGKCRCCHAGRVVNHGVRHSSDFTAVYRGGHRRPSDVLDRTEAKSAELLDHVYNLVGLEYSGLQDSNLSAAASGEVRVQKFGVSHGRERTRLAKLHHGAEDSRPVGGSDGFFDRIYRSSLPCKNATAKSAASAVAVATW